MGQFYLSVGVFLLGIFLNTFLFGLVCFQYLTYKSIHFKDPLRIKAVVVCLFFVDTAHSAVGIYGAWFWAVENYANPAALTRVIWITPFCASATSVSSVLVQLFLLNRVYQLSRHKILVGVLAAASFSACICGIVDGAKSGLMSDVSTFSKLIPLTIAWLAIESTVDICITCSLSFFLWRSRTGIGKTDTMIKRLIRGAIQTGLFSSIFAIINLVVFVVYPQTNLYVLFNWPLGRIYTNTLLDTLIARKALKALGSGVHGFSTGGTPQTFAMHTTRPAVHSIHVQQEVCTDSKLEDESILIEGTGAGKGCL